MEREQRKHEIATLKYEHILNAGLEKRLANLLSALKTRADDAGSSDAPKQRAAELAFRAVMESAPKNPEDDKLPPRPEGVHEGQGEGYPTTYSKMLVTVLDHANKALDEKTIDPEKRFEAMVEELGVHLQDVRNAQAKGDARLKELEALEGRKITSENYHTGFDSSHVNKKSSDAKGKETTSSQELLNPEYAKSLSSGAAPQQASKAGDDDEEIEATPDAKKFAKIPVGDYRASLSFITSHPHIVTEQETDGLLVEAFNAGLEGNDQLSLQCVHQALLLQYCRALGKDGVGLFFKRISDKGGKAHEMFSKDVQETYGRIRVRTREIKKEREAEASAGGVEQIQLHAVEPGTTINITIPEADSQDEAVRAQRAIYEAFKPEVKKALESGSLDEVNKALGAMKVDEAEELVGLLGDVSSFPAVHSFVSVIFFDPRLLMSFV